MFLWAIINRLYINLQKENLSKEIENKKQNPEERTVEFMQFEQKENNMKK